MIKTENFEKVEISSAAELRTWLMEHHNQTASVWLVIFKKHVGDKYVSIDEILDELLCFGWIDGIARKLDDDRSLRLVSPRKVKHWAESYKRRAERLIKEGRMASAGLKSFEIAKETGAWAIMDDVDALSIPDDLAKILKAHPPATQMFDKSAPSYRRNILRWLKLAKTSETRAKRLKQIAQHAQSNKRIPQM